MYKIHSINFKTPWEDTETNKGTQRGLQQTPKWNKGHYKKGDIWTKVDNKKHKRGIKQKYGKPQKKESNRNPEFFN
jgi:hypothetical protein